MHHPPTKPPKGLCLSDSVHQLLALFLNRRYQTTRYTTKCDNPWFVQRTVLKLDKLSIRGIIYASAESLPRDSNIIFRKPGDRTLRIGNINTIFSASYRQASYQEAKITCLVMEDWSPVMDTAAQRTYQQFGFAGGFLCRNEVVEMMSVVEEGDIVCHFAKTFLGQRNGEIFHALPLNKVR